MMKITENMYFLLKHMVEWKSQLKYYMIKCVDNSVWLIIKLHERVHDFHLGASYKAGESK